jgi:hypothetical protein
MSEGLKNICPSCGRNRCVDPPGPCPGVIGEDFVQRECPSTKASAVKHPGPWRLLVKEDFDVGRPDCKQAGWEIGDVVDADGDVVLFGQGQPPYRLAGGNDPFVFASDYAERLILAAPELLEFVEKLRDQDLDMETGGNALNDERDAILARIEKGTT